MNIGKRIFDMALSLFLLLLLLPILIFVAISIVITQGMPIFYTSNRHKNIHETFRIYKFRSMVKDATNEEKYKLYEKYFVDGFLDIPPDAEVYTPIGRFLERTQLVEVPQLYNVLLGEMSIVGNRPLPSKNIEAMKSSSGWEKRFDSIPGLTGISQIVGKHNITPENRLKLESIYSSVYKKGRNILHLDFLILYYTAVLILFDRELPIEKAYVMLDNFQTK